MYSNGISNEDLWSAQILSYDSDELNLFLLFNKARDAVENYKKEMSRTNHMEKGNDFSKRQLLIPLVTLRPIVALQNRNEAFVQLINTLDSLLITNPIYPNHFINNPTYGIFFATTQTPQTTTTTSMSTITPPISVISTSSQSSTQISITTQTPTQASTQSPASGSNGAQNSTSFLPLIPGIPLFPNGTIDINVLILNGGNTIRERRPPVFKQKGLCKIQLMTLPSPYPIKSSNFDISLIPSRYPARRTTRRYP